MTLLQSESKTNTKDTALTYHNLEAHQNCHHNHCRDHKPILEECNDQQLCTGNCLKDHTL